MINPDNKVSYAQFFKDAREVYSWLEDDISKKIFNAKMFCTENTIKNEIIKESSQKYFKELEDDHELIIIYGAGGGGTFILENLDGKKKNIIFCDARAHEIKEFMGFPVISPEELVEQYSDVCVFISTFKFNSEIRDFLKKNKLKELSFFRLMRIFVDEEQYFDPIVDLGDEEVFVDVGVLDGETSLQFSRKTGGKYEKIHLIEPDFDLYDKIKENTKHLENIVLHPVGLWHQKETLSFDMEGSKGLSSISEQGTQKIQVEPLDSLLENEKVTFIKMDIEGAELNALKGAKEIIRTQKPKLAICIYHKPEDIIEIPAFIKSLVPEYKFYIRHYSSWVGETVLYAIPPKQ